METVFILFVCDAWHTNESKRVISVCTTLDYAQGLAETHAKNEGEPLTVNDVLNLALQGQTQSRDVNFIVEETTLNCYFQ